MSEHPNIALARRCYDACNRGDGDTLQECFAPDAVHYFTGRSPVAGAPKLIAFCLASIAQVQAFWTIDHAMATDDEVVIEWSQRWKPRAKDQFVLTRGTEWILAKGGRISERRTYFQRDVEETTTELQGFPYRERGYTLLEQ